MAVIAGVRSYVGRHFVMMLDGYKSVGFLKSVDGGAIKAEVVAQQVGGQAMKVKHVALPKYEPFTVSVGMAMSADFYKWVANSWSGAVERRNGSILTCDRNLKPMHEQSFINALVTETQIPTLDATSKEPAYMTVKFQAETSRHKVNPGLPPVKAEQQKGQKIFQPCNFILDIDGLDCSKVSKIESFTIKQNVKMLETGYDRDYQLEPTSLEYPNLTLMVNLSHAKDFFDWHEDFVINGNNSADKEKTGTLTFLSPNRQKELLKVNLVGVGISNVVIDKSDSGQDQIKKVKVELYVEEMTLDYAGTADDVPATANQPPSGGGDVEVSASVDLGGISLSGSVDIGPGGVSVSGSVSTPGGSFGGSGGWGGG